MVDSRYMEFDFVGWSDSGKTKRWDVLSKSTQGILGHILWYGAWRQYCFYPSPQTVFNSSCMGDICEFIDEEMEARRTK